MSGWDLDFSNVEETGVAIEPGEYAATVDEAELKDTKSGDGQYVNVKFKLDNGKIVYHMFNIKNKNEQAMQIGKGQLKGMMRLAGKADPTKCYSADELIGLRVGIIVALKTDDYGTKPKITSFKAVPKSAAKAASPF